MVESRAMREAEQRPEHGADLVVEAFEARSQGRARVLEEPQNAARGSQRRLGHVRPAEHGALERVPERRQGGRIERDDEVDVRVVAVRVDESFRAPQVKVDLGRARGRVSPVRLLERVPETRPRRRAGLGALETGRESLEVVVVEPGGGRARSRTVSRRCSKAGGAERL